MLQRSGGDGYKTITLDVVVTDAGPHDTECGFETGHIIITFLTLRFSVNVTCSRPPQYTAQHWKLM
jgi:hypothetical protein